MISWQHFLQICIYGDLQQTSWFLIVWTGIGSSTCRSEVSSQWEKLRGNLRLPVQQEVTHCFHSDVTHCRHSVGFSSRGHGIQVTVTRSQDSDKKKMKCLQWNYNGWYTFSPVIYRHTGTLLSKGVIQNRKMHKILKNKETKKQKSDMLW